MMRACVPQRIILFFARFGRLVIADGVQLGKPRLTGFVVIAFSLLRIRGQEATTTVR